MKNPINTVMICLTIKNHAVKIVFIRHNGAHTYWTDMRISQSSLKRLENLMAFRQAQVEIYPDKLYITY